MIIRLALIGSGTQTDPFAIDLPTFSGVVTNEATGRAFADVPVSDIPADVVAFVNAYPTFDLVTPLPVPFPQSLANAWAEYLARRYDLGNVRWHPVVF
ncbi:MAG: hypothetical protein EBY17_28785 [Acidobacteriia bacterium]|nr:hypothetical protein [Terriglobia bacterium]